MQLRLSCANRERLICRRAARAAAGVPSAPSNLQPRERRDGGPRIASGALRTPKAIEQPRKPCRELYLLQTHGVAVPEDDRAVIATRGKPAAIGGDGEGAQRARVRLRSLQQLCGAPQL